MIRPLLSVRPRTHAWYQAEGWICVWGTVSAIALGAILRWFGIDKGDCPGNFPDFGGG
jgi:hypothetical protein